MGNARTYTRPKVLKDSPVIKLDREKFDEYCKSIGHSESSLAMAYRSSGYLSKRFSLYGGTVSTDFIEWCNKIYPAARNGLEQAIIPETKPEEKKAPEQLSMLPALKGPDKVVTIQPVSLVGFNQMVEALNRIADGLDRLEKAWNGQRGDEA